MKVKSMVMTVALLLFAAVQLNAQKMPDVTVENFKGAKVSSKTICDCNKPVVISLWATYCKPCIKELDTVSELLEEWQEEVDFRYVAISIDDARAAAKARAFASGRGWDGIDLFFDVNGDLRRALNVSQVPHLLIYDAKGKLAYSHSGYVPGAENEILVQLKKLAQ